MSITQYTATIFLSAFLLFQVQPMLGKFILPWFGGGPAVWSACLLFFQLFLLAGYAYAHALDRWLTPRNQALVHVSLLGLSLLLLPITPSESWKPASASAPALRIVLLLAVSVGAQYVMVSATSPLLQRWFGWSFPQRSPYRLYAVSNIGSLLGLLCYPFAIEPIIGLRLQTLSWSVGYVAFVALCAWCAVALCRENLAPQAADAEAADAAPARPLSGFDRGMWLALAACGSTLLLSTTNRMTQDIAPVPFLWVVPLALYLLSFILCFGNERWYDRRVWGPALLLCLGGTTAMLHGIANVDLWHQVVVFSVTLFVCCMVCHGELVRLRPAARHLTAFYLTVAAGGALGGVCVSLLAPAVFPGLWEFHLSLLSAYLLFAICLFADRTSPLHRGARPWAWGLLFVGFCAVDFFLGRDANAYTDNLIARSRNFYGILKVREYGLGTTEWRRYLVSGQIKHGAELMDEQFRRMPITYYGPNGGIAVAIREHPRRAEPGVKGLRIGVAGLGCGTVAALARKGDTVRFYEINPEVVRLSRKYFHYTEDSRAKVELALGDARISLERELARGENQRFDVLALDAFNSDAVPVHLLTREAAALYWQHLKPDGILAVHISNQHLDLAPIARALAEASGKEAVCVIEESDTANWIYYTKWVLVTSNPKFLKDARIRRYFKPWSDEERAPILWTDDYSNLFRILR